MYRQIFGTAATADTLTFLRREVMHAVWQLLLDDDFMDAYTNGVVIKFHDVMERLLFPRFFTYSADYPEKCDFSLCYCGSQAFALHRVLLACIKHLGSMPCPRCLVPKDHIRDIGKKVDMSRRDRLARVDDDRRKRKVEAARRFIYEQGKRPNSKAVTNILGSKSLTPTRVRSLHFARISVLILTRMLSRSVLDLMALTSTHFLLLTCCTNLSWGFGRQPSHIFFEFFMPNVVMLSQNSMNGKCFKISIHCSHAFNIVVIVKLRHLDLQFVGSTTTRQE